MSSVSVPSSSSCLFCLTCQLRGEGGKMGLTDQTGSNDPSSVVFSKLRKSDLFHIGWVANLQDSPRICGMRQTLGEEAVPGLLWSLNYTGNCVHLFQSYFWNRCGEGLKINPMKYDFTLEPVTHGEKPGGGNNPLRTLFPSRPGLLNEFGPGACWWNRWNKGPENTSKHSNRWRKKQCCRCCSATPMRLCGGKRVRMTTQCMSDQTLSGEKYKPVWVFQNLPAEMTVFSHQTAECQWVVDVKCAPAPFLPLHSHRKGPSQIPSNPITWLELLESSNLVAKMFFNDSIKPEIASVICRFRC